MDYRQSFEAILHDSWARPLPRLLPREARLHTLPGKADAVIGMRRVGKSSMLMHHLAQRIAAGSPLRSLITVNFEDDRLVGLTAAELHQLHEAALRLGEPGPEWWFYLDEVQVVPGWERFVRRLVELPRVRVIVTGSSSKLLSTELATAMRGRSLTTELLPFSFREALMAWGLEAPSSFPADVLTQTSIERAFERYLVTGGFPEVLHVDAPTREALARNYLDVVLLRDVIERHSVGQPGLVRALARRMLAAPGGAFTVNKATNDLKSQGFAVSRELVAALVGHFEDAFMFFAVPLATDSERKRSVNARKIYPVDPLLSAGLARMRSENAGWRLETLVYLELRRRGYNVGWGRTNSGFEVDFVARDSAETLLVQVALELDDPGTRARELRALSEAAAEHGARRALLITRSQRGTARAGPATVEVVPAAEWFAAPLSGCG